MMARRECDPHGYRDNTMPDYFVCTHGPMGGVSIVFVANDRASCDQFINQRSDKTDEYFVYVNDDLDA